MTLDDEGVFGWRDAVDLVLRNLDDVGAGGEERRVGQRTRRVNPLRLQLRHGEKRGRRGGIEEESELGNEE